MKDISIQEIGRRLGVHHATVSRALNGRAGVSAPLRRKILSLARELGYAAPRRRAIAVILRLDGEGMDDYSYTLLYFLSRAINAAGYRIEILYENDLDLINDRLVDAGVSLLPFNRIARFWARNQALPLVCINDYSDRLGGVCAVLSDDRSSMQFAVGELCRAGHRHIAYVSLEVATRNTDLRRRYFDAAMHFPGAGAPVILTGGDARQIVAAMPPAVTAVVCVSELLGEELYRALRSAGRLPDDRSFVSWAMPGRHWYRDAGIATVIQDYAGLSRHAVELLSATFAGTPPGGDRLVPCITDGFPEYADGACRATALPGCGGSGRGQFR